MSREEKVRGSVALSWENQSALTNLLLLGVEGLVMAFLSKKPS
jgi:hypothetical protein